MQTEHAAPPEAVEAFRRAFHADRLALIKAHGPEAFDQAQVLYIDAETGRRVVIRDAYQPLPGGPGACGFIEGLTEGWWLRRQAFEGEATPGASLVAVAGLYARYLPEVGFDYSVEFAGEGATHAWRMNARAQVTQLTLPADEGMFRDQTGTFFEPRAGWRWLVAEHLRTGQVVVAEVQGGYQIGVRAGVPDDPNPGDREDEALAEAFSRWDPHDYDTLEFLNGIAASEYPFTGERYLEWLGEAAAQAADAGQIDLFALAESSEFLACIEDLAKERGVAVEWIDPEEDIQVALHAGPLRLVRPFALPYLHTLHSGRSFVAGAREAYGPALDALDEARALLGWAQEALTGHSVDVVDGVVMRVRDGAGREVQRFNLMAMAGRQPFVGTAGRAAFLRLLGWDEAAEAFVAAGDALDVCPVTGAPARVGKVIRPAKLLGIDPRTLVGVPIGDHLVYYTLDSATHSTPVTPGAGRDLQTLEAAWREALPDTPFQIAALQRQGDALLIAGFDAGSLFLEPGRVKAVLQALEAPDAGEREIYAFHPDVLVVSPEPLTGQALDQARLAALGLQRAQFPGRAYAMAVHRHIDLGDTPLGAVGLDA